MSDDDEAKAEERLLLSFWTKIDRPGAFAGVDKLYRSLRKAGHRVTLPKVREFLRDRYTYQLHAPVKKRFPRRPILVSAQDILWDADLLDLGEFVNYNYRNRYVLTVVDVFSRKAHAQAMTNKTAPTTAKAFARIIAENDGRTPINVRTDHGNEFKGDFGRLLKRLNVEHVLTSSPEIKANYVERFHRTFRDKMRKRMTYYDDRNWTRTYKKLIASYNATPHRSLGSRAAPDDVNAENAGLFFSLMRRRSRRGVAADVREPLSVGDPVRIAVLKRGAFAKASKETFTDEIFRIKSVSRGRPTLYKIEDVYAPPEEVVGSFYREELQSVKPTAVELRRVDRARPVRKGRFDVSFRNWPSKFDATVSKTKLRSYAAPK
jgi:hypothetical protein